MSSPQPYVSVIEPISPAIERVKDVLFRPFDLGRWFVIGFCAWLATMGRGGGGGRINFPGNGRAKLEDVWDAAVSHPWIPIVIVIVVVLAIVIGLVVLWLSSRGRFMFLYCVAQNKAEVKAPWHHFRGHGNSLFAFRFVLGICGVLAVAAFVIPAIAVYSVHETNFALSVAGIGALVLSAVVVVMILAIIGAFTNDFVVPIMYLNGLSCRQGWAILLDLLGGNKLRFVLYLLFQFVLGLAIGAIVMALSCVTCGCACCLFALPYVGTVALLPVLMFQRAYSLHYLAQYGPQFNVFPSEEPPMAAPEPMT